MRFIPGSNDLENRGAKIKSPSFYVKHFNEFLTLIFILLTYDHNYVYRIF